MHYTLLIVGAKNQDEVHQMLAPYIKDNCWELNLYPELDWYVIGGRWRGFFVLKKAATVPRTLGVLHDAGNRADRALKGDIDFEAMRVEAAERAADRYDAVAAAIDGTPVNETWEVICTDIGAMEDARREYGEQRRVQAFERFAGTELGREMLGHGASVDQYNVPRAEYIKHQSDAAITTYAILKDGHWHCSSTKDDETWHSMFANLINDLPDDNILTLVDCHI
jgi:hypothetical protein